MVAFFKMFIMQLKNIDFSCNVHVFFLSRNKGCRQGNTRSAQIMQSTSLKHIMHTYFFNDAWHILKMFLLCTQTVSLAISFNPQSTKLQTIRCLFQAHILDWTWQFNLTSYIIVRSLTDMHIIEYLNSKCNLFINKEKKTWLNMILLYYNL